jgi:hypothetical protein
MGQWDTIIEKILRKPNTINIKNQVTKTQSHPKNENEV